MVTRIHNFLVKDPDACAVFMEQSARAAGVDATLKLTRLVLISLFLCYNGAVGEVAFLNRSCPCPMAS